MSGRRMQLPAIIDRTEIIGDAGADIVPTLVAVAGGPDSIGFCGGADLLSMIRRDTLLNLNALHLYCCEI
jgi:hypothetical protein